MINDYVYDPSWGASEPGVYRWEAKSGTYQSVTTGSAINNGLAMSQGSISGTSFTDGRFSLHDGVVLKHMSLGLWSGRVPVIGLTAPC